MNARMAISWHTTGRVETECAGGTRGLVGIVRWVAADRTGEAVDCKTDSGSHGR
jgi:hypothetical protein